tara:strand:- start:524 stop:1006 length:483 start_codon:yes stop_codon:yes gene_type:complete
MRTVSSCVNDKEYAVIQEYANQCGESVSNVLKKAVLEWTALSQEGYPEGYRLDRLVPDGMDEDVSPSKDVNKIRQILGWNEVDLVQPKSIGVKESNEQPAPVDEEESNLINDLANRIREEQPVVEEENKKQPTKTLEGYGAWLRKNKIIKSAEEPRDFSD